MKPNLVAMSSLLVADQAFAESGFCFPGAPWCGSELGLTWVPIVVGLQLAFLYVAQGGPGAFLAQFAGHDENFANVRFGILQIGLPIALVLSFPALMGLVLIDKWLRPVGLLEIVMVQGLYWLWLSRWRAWRTEASACDRKNAQPDDPLSQLHQAQGRPANDGFIGISPLPDPGRSPIDVGVAAILPRAPIDGIPMFPGAARPQDWPMASRGVAPEGGSARPLHPGRAYADVSASCQPPPETRRPPGHPDNKSVLDRLTSTYMWDDAGSGQAFKAARKLPAQRLLTEDDRSRYGGALLDALRCVARHTAALYRYGVDTTTFATILSMHSAEGFDEYSADVMQRLTYSALCERQRLFIDQTDIEIFGEDFMECLYRLALLESVEGMSHSPIAGIVHGAAGHPLLQ